MGAPYTILDHIHNVDYDPITDIVVEIGSENGEGSSKWLYQWSTARGMNFYSVDVEPRKEEMYCSKINWVISESGSVWCKDILPGLNKSIKVLYLDNFDYMYGDTHPTIPDIYREQVKSYANRGIIMNNQNSMEEHRLQTKYCLPYMAEQSIIIMDDTYYNPQLQSQDPSELKHWYGKCATALPLMIEAGFSIVRDKEHDINYAIRSR
jgi:hypothetical protein